MFTKADLTVIALNMFYSLDGVGVNGLLGFGVGRLPWITPWFGRGGIWYLDVVGFGACVGVPVYGFEVGFWVAGPWYGVGACVGRPVYGDGDNLGWLV